MAKNKLRDEVIEEINKDENILQEGILQVMRLYTTNRNRYPYKYVITDKGVWTRSKKFLWIKAKTVFMAYADISKFQVGKYGKVPYFVFYPANGKRPGNRVFFDNHDGAYEILSKFSTHDLNKIKV